MNFSETIFLFLLALLVFGPKKLPEIARQIGKALNEFRRASNEFKAQIEAEVQQLEYQEREKQRREEEQKLLAAPPEPVPGTVEAGPSPGPSETTESVTPPSDLNSASQQTSHA